MANEAGNPRSHRPAESTAAWLLRNTKLSWDRLVGGGPLRRRLLVALLRRHFVGEFRRQWTLSIEPPHFSDIEMFAFFMLYGPNPGGAAPLTRAFLTADALKPGDVVLDIGCGDGFFTRRFYGMRCAEIDAIDIEPASIRWASKHNSAPNIHYQRLDAVTDPFPRASYDVIIWDSALGHFTKESSVAVLKKIRTALKPGGLFVGSETLGLEGEDHLQRFMKTEDFKDLFLPHFAQVRLKSLGYRLGFSGEGAFRNEAYWRCSTDLARLDDADWQRLT